MIPPIVERTSQAEIDLYEIAIYIGERNPEAALRFLVAAEATWKKTAAMPGIGRLREFKNSALKHLRSVKIDGFENYLVFYRSIKGGIEVIRVLHGARNLESLF